MTFFGWNSKILIKTELLKFGEWSAKGLDWLSDWSLSLRYKCSNLWWYKYMLFQDSLWKFMWAFRLGYGRVVSYFLTSKWSSSILHPQDKQVMIHTDVCILEVSSHYQTLLPPSCLSALLVLKPSEWTCLLVTKGCIHFFAS